MCSSSCCFCATAAVDINSQLRRRADVPAYTLFDEKSTAIIWGMQPKAVQGMLDFDYICSRSAPSVAAMTYPFSGDHKQAS